MRAAPAVLSAVAAVLLASACTGAEPPTCPGTRVADLRLVGALVPKGDPAYQDLEALDPEPDLPDCTPVPADTSAPIRYPDPLPPFEARLSAGPDADAAALCRASGSVLSGSRAGPSYALEAAADSAVVCGGACAAALRVVVKGDLAVDAGGAPTAFSGILVEVLAAEGGTCDACLPISSPPARACAARYALTGAPY